MATIAELMVKLSMDDGAFQRNLRSSREKLDSWGESFRGVGHQVHRRSDHADCGLPVAWLSAGRPTWSRRSVRPRFCGATIPTPCWHGRRC